MKKILSFVMAIAIVLSSMTITPSREVAAAVIDSGIITEGEGSLTQTLSNGKSVSVSLSNSVMTLTVDGQKWNYYDTPSVGTAVISDDDVLHVFWHSGHYYAFDLYEKDVYVMLGYNGVDQENVDYYIVSQPNDPNNVLGTSAGMANKTCILDKQYFKMYGQVLRKRLITRAQLEELIYGKKPTPEPTAVPTAVPTAKPTVAPTSAPTAEPTLAPTQEPMATIVPPTVPPVPTLTPATLAPMPSLPPLSVPTKAPTPTLKPLPTQNPSTASTPPDVTIDTTIDWTQKTEYDFYLEWQKNFSATMTWEEYAKMIWGESWQETSKTDTWYDYDDEGKLVHESTLTNTVGSSTGAAAASAAGTATVTGTEIGAAHLTGSTYNEGQAAIHTEVRGSTGGSSSKSKNVISYSVRYPQGKTGYVSLVRTVNKKAGVICKVKVNYKKHTAKFDGKVYKNVKQVYYSLKSRQILIRYQNNTWDVVARAKGKAGTKYTTKRLKGIWNKVSMTPNEHVNRIMRVKKGKKKIVVKGVSNVQPKKL